MRALDDLLSDGRVTSSRNGGTHEIVGWSAQLINPQLNFLANPRRKLSPIYACAELVWYLSGQSSIEIIKHYAPQYVKFAETDLTAYGAYGARLRNNIDGYDQIELILDCLKRKSDSRQAIAAMWRPYDLWQATHGSKKDLPCTLTWQFFVRDDKLHMVVNMRSNDVWLGLPYDIFVNTCYQALIAEELGLEVGTYTHHVGSLHVYEKDMHKIREARRHALCNTIVHHWDGGWISLQEARLILDVESKLRKERLVREELDIELLSPMAQDIINCLASPKDQPTKYRALVHSSALRRGLEEMQC